VPEDRFKDLGEPEPGPEDDPERKPARSRAEEIGDMLEERDRVAPEPGERPQRPPEVPRPGNKYAWVVGIVMLMGIGVLLLTTAIPNSGAGVRGPERGQKLLEWSAPLATGTLDDRVANVRQSRGQGSDTAGKVPACDVLGNEAVNLCELRKKPLVLTFMVTKGADCEPQVDRVERMRREFPGVNFAVVMSGEKRADAEKIVRNRRWTLPVAVDKDGAVVNLNGVGICPVTVFARTGGRVAETSLGNLTEAQLRRKTQRLSRGNPAR